jgi:hypothetical protein
MDQYIWINTFFSVIVIGAVVFIGLVIAQGQNRQRQALDNMNRKIADWAEQDLRLKRAKAALEIAVPDTLTWVDQAAARIFGTPPALSKCDAWDGGGEKVALIGICQDGRRLVLTPVEPKRFREAVRVRRATGRMAALARVETSILGKSPHKVPVYEMNIVTAGIHFDLEADKVWQQAFKRPLLTDRLFMFEVSERA